MSTETGSTLTAKVVLLGDVATGAKTSLALRFVRDTFLEMPTPTIGAAFMCKVVDVDGVKVKLEIWDTAGQERFHAMAPMWYHDAQAAIVGFDVTNLYSLKVCDSWIQELRTNVPDCVVVTVGNKIDLVDERRISTEEARAHFETMNPPVPYFETSAKTGEGVNELFDAVGRTLIQRNALTVNKVTNKNKIVKDAAENQTPQDGKCVIC